MKPIVDYAKVFETLVQKTQDYLQENGLKSMILGISGGIDSTVVAAICHEVSRRTGIPLIGRSLPSKYNKEGETTTADLVGKAFCTDYRVFNINTIYNNYIRDIIHKESGHVNYTIDSDGNISEVKDDFLSPIAKGNIQARLRMIYLYNLASLFGGLVMDTDNLTENNLGYFTIHGDVGDFNPIGCLWKTEVFELAKYLTDYYKGVSYVHSNPELILENLNKSEAIAESLKLKPTAGLGITNNDLEELGAESYDQVDYILQEIVAWKWVSLEYRKDKYDSIAEMQEAFLEEQAMLDMPIKVIVNITKRHFNSEFKRKQLPIKINREEITQNKIVQ
jgi:NAD+ synthetase